MADYWRSNERKYCTFCKCWIADNKPSVEFHENGKKHKENVQRHLNNVARQSATDNAKKAKEDDAIKKMERDALNAYRNDVANGVNDYSATISHGHIEAPGSSSSCTDPTPALHENPISPEYVHSKTRRQIKLTAKDPATASFKSSQGPVDAQGFGQWKTTVETKPSIIDLQLPEIVYETSAVPVYVPKVKSPPKFVVKVIKRLNDDEGTGSGSGFKKTKFGNKRNIRRQGDTDE